MRPIPDCLQRLFVGMGVLLLVPATFAQAPTQPIERPFVRFTETGDDGRLDVMIATYRRADVTVTLLGSVHIADRSHYAAMQQRFATFDALLYEMVGDPEAAWLPVTETEDDLLSQLMQVLGDGMGLAQQFDGVDYRQSNFVHADMTQEEFEASLERAGTTLLGELFANGLPEVDRDAEARLRKIDMVGALRTGRGNHELRVLMARMLAEEEAPRRRVTVTIEGRNERCLDVLAQQIAAGRRKLGIYYGAAHMAHLERRLTGDLDFRKVSEEWINAWDCSRARDPLVERGLQRKRYRATADLEELRDVVRAWQSSKGTKQVPTWDVVRAVRPDRKLPGRADGLDPWGRPYALRAVGDDGAFEIRSLGSDGEPDTDDDLVVASPAPRDR